jgi:hypothetical protein
VNEQEWLAMRGFVDIVFGALLVSRFLYHSAQLQSLRARLAQLTVLSLLLAILELIGVWSWREIVAATKVLPVVWPVFAVSLYLTYRTFRLWRNLQKAKFEIDWRREYQEVLMKQLEQSGRSAPDPPHFDSKQR